MVAGRRSSTTPPLLLRSDVAEPQGLLLRSLRTWWDAELVRLGLVDTLAAAAKYCRLSPRVRPLKSSVTAQGRTTVALRPELANMTSCAAAPAPAAATAVGMSVSSVTHIHCTHNKTINSQNYRINSTHYLAGMAYHRRPPQAQSNTRLQIFHIWKIKQILRDKKTQIEPSIKCRCLQDRCSHMQQ